MQRKRPLSVTSEDTPTKRRPSPIRFSDSDAASNGKVGSKGKRDDRSLYEPPRDRFSKNIGDEPIRGRRGRGRGRGWRGF